MIFILTSFLNLIFTRTIHSYQLNQINVSLNMVQPMKYRIYNLKLVKRTQKKSVLWTNQQPIRSGFLTEHFQKRHTITIDICVCSPILYEPSISLCAMNYL